jgi:anti-sigma B factor antagonist
MSFGGEQPFPPGPGPLAACAPVFAVVHAEGEFDLATSPGLAHDLAAAVRTVPDVVVVDLTAVTFFSSSAINVLLQARRDCELRSISLRVVAPHQVRRVLELTGLCALFTLFDTADEARAG